MKLKRGGHTTYRSPERDRRIRHKKYREKDNDDKRYKDRERDIKEGKDRKDKDRVKDRISHSSPSYNSNRNSKS